MSNILCRSKSFERKSRSKASTYPIHVNVQRPDQPIPSDWSRFMSSSGNKTDLIRFLARHWSEDQAALHLKPGRTIFVTVGKECWRFKVTQEGQYVYSSVPELKSTQEESDTRMFLHAHHAFSSGYSTVVIRFMDTDVFWLALGLLFSLPGQVLLMTGSKAKARVIDINKVAASLGQRVCMALIGLHAFTGCDAISAFSGNCKRKGLQLVRGSEELADAMAALGFSFTASETALLSGKLFACAMYGEKDGSRDINQVRYRLFCDPQKAREPRQLRLAENSIRVDPEQIGSPEPQLSCSSVETLIDLFMSE